MNKSQKIKYGLLVVLFSLAPMGKMLAKESRPNIDFVICDQMRGNALGALGNPNARAPNLDKMASQSVDLFPTLVGLTGGKIPGHLFDRSLKPFLFGHPENDNNHIIYTSATYRNLPVDYFDHPILYYDDEKKKPFHSRA